MVWKHNGNEIKVGSSWVDKNGFKHPYNWESAWSDADKKSFGVTWTKDADNSFDKRFYWSKGVEKKLQDEDAKSVDGKQLYERDGKTKIINKGLKTVWIEKIKSTANAKLQETDWYIIRASDDSSLAVPSDISEKRKSIRNTSKNIEDKINACKTLAEFKKLFDNTDGEIAPIFDWGD